VKPTRLISPPGTYFVTFSTFQRRRLFVVESYARLFLKTLYGYRRQGRFQLHAFVLMPDHVHLLLTPARDVTLERAIQLIKGGYSHAVGIEISRKEIWQKGFTDHRIRECAGFCGASVVYPSESGDGEVGCECDGVSVLLGVPGVQAGCLAPSG
jgi:REP element-mobilizing transposase RayT